MNRINNNYNNNNNNTKNMDINRTVTRKARTKLKAINNFLICCLCKGYIVEATAISDCLHSFCRSCIVKHLTENTFCPKCSLQNVSKASLRPDDIIKSLVFKVVPALFQNEIQNKKKFDKFNNIVENQNEDEKCDSRKQHYFSPDELISLSLKYHAESLVGSGVSVTALPINYLQCPAAVTVHHLKRFVSAKYGIDIERDVNIEIICEDEVLPEDFTLIDVAYCFNWTRTCPMQLMYRIFLFANNNEDQQENSKDIALSVENKNQFNQNDNINRKQTTDNKNHVGSNHQNKYTNNVNNNRNSNSNGRSYSNYNDTSIKTSDTDNKFLVPSLDFKRLRSCANFTSGTNQSSPPKEFILKETISVSNKSGTVTHDVVKQCENKTNLSLVAPTPVAHSMTNDKITEKSKNNDYYSNSIKTKLLTKDLPNKNVGINSNSKESINVVSKTQNINTNKGELKLKYEAGNTKKCYTNTKKNTSSQIHEETNIKLQTELPTIKSKEKIESSKTKDEGVLPKIILKLSSPVEKNAPTQSNTNVDVKEYAKKIGLLPVSELQERKKREKERRDELSHKKRKKAKHSKEPNGKKRKIHAEVSSLTLNDEVKLKVKISKPPSKHEKRNNSTDNSSNSEQNSNTDKHDKSKEEPSNAKQSEQQPATSSILRTVRHKSQAMVYIPNLDKNIPEEQDSIADIVKRVQVPVNKSPINVVLPTKPQSPLKSNSPLQRSQGSPLQKASSPILNAKHGIQNKNQKMLQTQQPRQNINPVQKPLNALEACQMFQKAQSGKVMMPPFNPIDIRMQRMNSTNNIGRAFSPRSNNSTNPLPISTFSLASMPQVGKQLFGFSSPNTQQQQKQPMKRPAGSDTPLPMPKTPRVNHMDFVDYQNTGRKQVYATMMKPPLEPRSVPSKPVSAPQLVQQSKKPVDQKNTLSCIIAPSSISVTRVGDTLNVPVQQVNRPAVEILKIPSTVPAIDQKSNSIKPQQKITRPPPGTIPLSKFQKSVQMGKTIINQVTNKQKSEAEKALDLSLSPTGGIKSTKVDTGPVIDLTDSTDIGSSRKTSDDKLKLAQNNTTPLNNFSKNNGAGNVSKTTKPVMPGLTALNPKNQGLIRQQNMSVRNVPNPSALAFRSQLPSLTKVNLAPTSKLNDKVQQLHNMKEQQRQRIAPED